MPVSVTLRSVKGTPLTIAEVDGNFTNIKNAVDGQDATIAANTALVGGMDARVDVLEAASTDYENRITTLESGGGTVAGEQPFFSATKSANQTILATSILSSTKISFNTENADSEGAYNSTTSVFTAPSTGWYCVSASLRVDRLGSSLPVDPSLGISVKVNGSDAIVSEFAQDVLIGQTITANGLVHMNATDTLEAYFDCALGSGTITWQLTNDGTKSFFQAFKIHS